MKTEETKPTHTPEPWYFEEYSGLFEIQTEPGYTCHNILDKDQDPNAEANAQRIIDCVNACAGIENLQVLTAIFKAAKGLRTTELITELTQQRDELLAALEDIFSATNTFSNKGIDINTQANIARLCKELIVKMKGEAS